MAQQSGQPKLLNVLLFKSFRILIITSLAAATLTWGLQSLQGLQGSGARSESNPTPTRPGPAGTHGP
jgi:hypothetical protein